VRISVRVHPRAIGVRVVLKSPGEGDVWVTAPPAENRANEAVQEALAEYLGVAKSRVRLVRGGRGRNKVFEVA
jgi:hypothetical protein